MALKNAIKYWQAMPSNANRQTHKRNILPDEESFFNAMMDYFNLQQFAVSINAQKTHQKYVLPGNVRPLCEISDVLFLVCSHQYHITRMTHMEVKKKDVKEAVGLPLNRVSSFEHPLSMRQYQLLNGRLSFANIGNSNYPVHTFDNPLFSDSIASYGVFYIDSRNDWNLAYQVATAIRPISNRRGEFLYLQDNWRYWNSFSNVFIPPQSWLQIYSAGDNCLPLGGELISTLDTDVFETELCQCHIGSRLFPGDKVSKEIITHIYSVLTANYENIPHEGQVLIDNFRNYIIEEGFDLQDVRIEDNTLPRNIVLINADMANRGEE